MAVRLREIYKDQWVALCAAEHEKRFGDVYLDDAQDHALRKKYIEDYRQEGLIPTSIAE